MVAVAPATRDGMVWDVSGWFGLGWGLQRGLGLELELGLQRKLRLLLETDVGNICRARQQKMGTQKQN